MKESEVRPGAELTTTKSQVDTVGEPTWTRGEIVGRPLWPFLGGLAALVVVLSLGRSSVHGPNVLVAAIVILSLAGIFGLAVALERCQSVRWDENGMSVSFLGRPIRSLAWQDVASLDKDRRIWLKNGDRTRLLSMFATGVQAGARLEVAAIIHGGLWNQTKVATRALPGTPYDALSRSKRTQTQNSIWRRIVADLAHPNAPGWETAPTPGLYVYKTYGYKVQSTIYVLGFIGFYSAREVIEDAVKHPGWAAVAKCLLLFALGGVVVAAVVTYQRLLNKSGVRVEDTVEVSGDGLRIWRDGQATPWLQYPRRVSTRKVKWLPGGSYQTWSNGEEQHAVDPRFLVRLQDDLPPEFAYAATEGAGWLHPEPKAIAAQMLAERDWSKPLLREKGGSD